MINFDLKKYLSPIFIETGTGLAGLGIKKAIEAGFKRIISIEISEELYLRASDNFRDEIMNGLVETRFGDSAELLPMVLEEIEDVVTFWLDAHIDGPQSGGVSEQKCPLYAELGAINKHKIKNHIIMINDRRLFKDNETRANINGWGQSVTENRIIDRVKDINGRYFIDYENGSEKEDVIVASVKCMLCGEIAEDGHFCNACYLKDKAKGVFE